MPPMSPTAAVFHPLMSWLKLTVLLNMLRILVTVAVFHPLISWLKIVAPSNMLLMVTTLPVLAHESAA